MKAKTAYFPILCALFFLIMTGCATNKARMFGKQNILLQSSEEMTVSQYKTFDEFSQNYEQVKEGDKTEDLWEKGLDPKDPESPNIEILTNIKKILDYVGVNEELIRSGLIDKDRIHPGIKKFIASTDKPRFAWLIKPRYDYEHSEGSTILNMLECQKITRETGWRGEGLIVFVESEVVYKIETAAGKPHVNKYQKQTKPLCFMQNDLPKWLVMPGVEKAWEKILDDYVFE